MQTEKIKTNIVPNLQVAEHQNVNDILQATMKKRLTYPFTGMHEEYQTHSLKIIHPDMQYIPVLVGSIP